MLLLLLSASDLFTSKSKFWYQNTFLTKFQLIFLKTSDERNCYFSFLQYHFTFHRNNYVIVIACYLKSILRTFRTHLRSGNVLVFCIRFWKNRLHSYDLLRRGNVWFTLKTSNFPYIEMTSFHLAFRSPSALFLILSAFIKPEMSSNIW